MKKIFLYPAFILLSFLAVNFDVVAQNTTDNDSPMSVFKVSEVRDLKPAEIPMPRRDDIVWSKFVWRKIDFRQTFNQFFYYPLNYAGVDDVQVGLRSFTDILWTAVMDGTITAYSSDKFDRAYTPEEVASRFKKETIRTVSEYNEELGFEADRVDTLRQEFKKENVVSMELAEVWYIDKQRSEQAVRIFGFALVMEETKVDEVTGEEFFEGELDVFWIKYDDPAVRQLLASEEVYNDVNDSYRRSFDDIFIQRYFDSYIVKESNIKDRRINSYAAREDALLESDRVKKDIMDKEIDMWEY